jgi:hypothetical protein
MATDASNPFPEIAVFRGSTFEPNSVPLVVAVKGEQQVGEFAKPQECCNKTRQITEDARRTVLLHLGMHDRHTDFYLTHCSGLAKPVQCRESLQNGYSYRLLSYSNEGTQHGLASLPSVSSRENERSSRALMKRLGELTRSNSRH